MTHGTQIYVYSPEKDMQEVVNVCGLSHRIMKGEPSIEPLEGLSNLARGGSNVRHAEEQKSKEAKMLTQESLSCAYCPLMA